MPINHASKIVQKKLKSLLPYENNSRLHSDAQVTSLAKIIENSGWTSPIIIDEENRIIAGHGRALAAAKLEMDTVPCIVVKGLSEEQMKAMRLADNRVALDSDWDLDALQLEITALQDMDFDMTLTGFGLGELETMFDEPEPPAPQVVSFTVKPKPDVVCPECGHAFQAPKKGAEPVKPKRGKTSQDDEQEAL